MLVFKIEQHRAKKEINTRLRRLLNEEDLTQIVVTSENKDQLHWEDKKEFKYKNKLYDIVKTKELNANSTIYFCISDDKETKLIDSYNELIKSNDETSKSSNITLKKTIELFLNLFIEDLMSFSHLIQNRIISYLNYNTDCSSAFHKVNIPPPKSI